MVYGNTKEDERRTRPTRELSRARATARRRGVSGRSFVFLEEFHFPHLLVELVSVPAQIGKF